jgi:hypothetical protein
MENSLKSILKKQVCYDVKSIDLTWNYIQWHTLAGPNVRYIPSHCLFPQLGGYILPFAVMGTFLMLDAIFIYFTLPPLGNEPGRLRPEGKFLL